MTLVKNYLNSEFAKIELEHKDFSGTGHSKLKPSYKKRIRDLNNTKLRPSEVIDFHEISGIKPINLEFSFRKTKRAWGVAWGVEERVILYRHSVGVYIHELAHIVVERDRKNGKYEGWGRIKPHGYEFTETLQELMDDWETTPFKEN